MGITKLKLKLMEKGLTQRKVAKKTGIHESIISLIATGRYIPDQNQKALISKALGERQGVLFDN